VKEMPLITESRILIVATNGFEEWELFGPRQILRNAAPRSCSLR
jgi:putative intracellular protease/amidase